MRRSVMSTPRSALASVVIFVVASAGANSGGVHALAARAGGQITGFHAAAANTSAYPCGTTFNAVIVPASAWASQLPPNSGHDGANYNVRSNYNKNRGYYNAKGVWVSSPCAGDILSSDPQSVFTREFQCTELAIRVADGEWSIGDLSAWQKAGWNGAADDMGAIGPKLGLAWVANASGSLPLPGSLMVWGTSGGGDPGHVAVVSSVGGGHVSFVGENQGDGLVTLNYSGSNVENNGWKAGSTILGWLNRVTYQGCPYVSTVSKGFTYGTQAASVELLIYGIISVSKPSTDCFASQIVVRTGVDYMETASAMISEYTSTSPSGGAWVLAQSIEGQRAPPAVTEFSMAYKFVDVENGGTPYPCVLANDVNTSFTDANGTVWDVNNGRLPNIAADVCETA